MLVGELVEPGRGSRRLCAVLAGGPPGLLTEVCRPSGRGGPFGFGRLYIAPTPDGEAAVAPVGVDEVRIVHDLMAVVRGHLGAGTLDEGSGRAEHRERAERGDHHEYSEYPELSHHPNHPTLLAFNVGIVRVMGNGFGGAGLARTWALTDHPAVRGHLDRLVARRQSATVAAAADAAPLAVVVATPLYADLCDEGLDRRDWREIRAAGAWMKWGTG